MITRRFFAAERRIAITIAILLAAAIIVPLLNLALSPASAFYVPSYMVALTGKYLCYALLALALDLVWGYCGILSLGHGAFSLGILNKFLEPYAGAVLGKILILVLIILFIQKRPRGLFALKGRAVEA